MNVATPQPAWLPVVRLIVVILVPLMAVLTSVRLLLTDGYIQIEYSMPGFPADPFGFTKQDRLHWAPIALDYLLNDQDVEFLGDLRFDDGSPVYNERELGHMLDVKIVTRNALKVWGAGWALLLVMGFLLWRFGGPNALGQAFSTGARATLILMLVLGLALAIGFSVFFVGFHRVFFEGETWIFPYSDTLIRLFPERFWRDSFAFIAAGTLAQAGIILLLTRVGLNRFGEGV
jgi:integral membrane protein (TIGR01906 family)